MEYEQDPNNYLELLRRHGVMRGMYTCPHCGKFCRDSRQISIQTPFNDA
ncbi:unnamed protein product [Nezara viridula]|uniref:Uncharacterized protein n=1 Tax=Nezara viridula TaxID=85310 RepID=A0A9P0E2M6_NEZVI|nr:unnamed protein product [Nezara viridula]